MQTEAMLWAFEARLALGLMEPWTDGQLEAGDKVQPVLKEDGLEALWRQEGKCGVGAARKPQKSFRIQFWNWGS